MHQYTAGLANQMVAAGHDVHVIGPTGLPRDRYHPAVHIHTPLTNRTTGFSREGLDLPALRRVLACLHTLSLPHLPTHPTNKPTNQQTNKPTNQQTTLHLTAPHLWNPIFIRRCHKRGLPAIHTIHDLDPHPGVPFGRLIPLWNRLILRQADHILVHGRCYRRRLVAQGLSPRRVTALPLLHLCFSHAAQAGLDSLPPPSPAAPPSLLFFGRLLPYKGIPDLLQAWQQAALGNARLILAGPGDLAALWPHDLPPGVELRNHLIPDAEAIALFQTCSLLVLPYVQATQSALIPAAYYFGKPVLAADTGALSEYILPNRTGWLFPPGDVPALAAALATLLTDPALLRGMGFATRAWYEAQAAHEQTALPALYTQPPAP